MKRLMHCPFCGEEEQIGLSGDLSSDSSKSWIFTVGCRGCGASGPGGESMISEVAETAAIDSWNNRITHQEDVALRTAFAMT